ncbi:MAG: hypothetical protein KDD39_00575 [Bdellovibrionales bacterium]|nr:hypothetical protein [Bdellovibrionales bacterium]
MKIKFLLLALVLVWGTSCNRFSVSHKGLAPEDVVKSFVELSASSKNLSDRRRLADFCAGELRRAFERMTDEAFKLSYTTTQLNIKEFAVVSSAIVERQATVRYRVVVENGTGTDPTLETNEREVELVENRGAWFLENIRPYGSDQIAFTHGMIF